MTPIDRRFLAKGLGLSALFPSIARALEIPAHTQTGTIKDVEHIVILTQENRSFDHYFGTLNGVQGFGDRFPIPVPDVKGRKHHTVFVQPSATKPHLIAPYHADTQAAFKYMRLEGTPHTFPDAQAAWDDGRLSDWPSAKHDHALAYFSRDDIPFQYALAEAFTLCDAYFCALHAGTDPNRLFIFTGTNDPLSTGHGPVVLNAYDSLKSDEHGHGGYEWHTYAERLQDAGIEWQVYQVMNDNFDDNSLVGFKTFRKANQTPSSELARRGLATRDLDLLKTDVLAGRLPQISYIVAPDRFSEHPGPSSPAQGADYTARVLDALTSNPEVWAKTVLLINFDENDGLFDHVPPPSPPSIGTDGQARGASQIDTTGEYYLPKDSAYHGRAFGLGPRVPLYVVSPFSKGGYVASQGFDHTSIIRFCEARFGVMEPNISPWRRAVCGDLLSCFDFKTPNTDPVVLPETKAASDKAHKQILWAKPPVPKTLTAPVQEKGLRKRRATPYQLEVTVAHQFNLSGLNFINDSPVATVFHVYDMEDLDLAPMRFTVAAHASLFHAWDRWTDLFIVGPNGFHRRIQGALKVSWSMTGGGLKLKSFESGEFQVKHRSYGKLSQVIGLNKEEERLIPVELEASHNWYDLEIISEVGRIRLAGHIETGQDSVSDPEAYGAAKLSMRVIDPH